MAGVVHRRCPQVNTPFWNTNSLVNGKEIAHNDEPKQADQNKMPGYTRCTQRGQPDFILGSEEDLRGNTAKLVAWEVSANLSSTLQCGKEATAPWGRAVI